MDFSQTKRTFTVVVNGQALHGVWIRFKDALSFFYPSATPALACDLFARKQRTAACSICRFALEQGAVVANLTRCVLGVLGFVGLGGVRKIAQGFGLWVGLSQRDLREGGVAQASAGHKASAAN